MTEKEMYEQQKMILKIEHQYASAVEKRIIEIQLQQLEDKMNKRANENPYYSGVGLT